MSNLISGRRRTVTRDLTIGLAFTIIIVISGISIYNYFRAVNQATADLENRATKIADNLAQVLASPLRNNDSPGIEQIANGYQQIDGVVILNIFDETHQVIYKFPQEDLGEQTGILSEQRTINFEDNPVGSVEVSFEKDTSDQINILLVNLWVGLALIVAVQVVTQFLLRRLLIKPLTQLTEGLEVFAGGDYKYKMPTVKQGDIDVIAQRANEMAEQISERDNQMRELIDTLEQRVIDRTQDLKGRTEQLEAIADVASSIATLRGVDQLLPEITNLISERFGFYHVGIFLLDDKKQFAIMRAANSEGGQKMLARQHRLQVGQEGIVGFVTSRGQARIALDVGEESEFFDNPELPDTHSEVALPLMLGQEIVGALDIQSKEINAFSQEDVGIFSILADQVSVAIQNAQSLDQAQRALHEADFATRQLTGRAWKEYTQITALKGYRYDGNKAQPLTEAGISPVKGSFKIPISYRGQEVATLVLEPANPDYEWSDDEISLAKAAADRTALALEGARLLEDAQRRGAKEQVIGEITSKITQSINLENILQTTLREIGSILPGADITIQVDKD